MPDPTAPVALPGLPPAPAVLTSGERIFGTEDAAAPHRRGRVAVPGASDSEASRLALRLRGESRRDAAVLSQRLLSELYGSDTVTLPEADYLAVVRGKLAADPGYATSLYKQVGPRRFVETMAAVRGLSPTDMRQQALASAEGRERATRVQGLSAAPSPPVAPPVPASQFVGPADAPSLPEVEGAPV